MLLTCGVPCEGAEISKHHLARIQPGEADPFGQLWGVGSPDFVLKHLDPLPEPLKTLTTPYALNPPCEI
eukprot:694090-Heterocapsa_arctica.AAC.1